MGNKRKADLISALAIKADLPRRRILETASSKDAYVTKLKSGSISSLREKPVGNYKWCIRRKLLGSSLGAKPKGETLKSVKGGDQNGPATLPSETSLKKKF